MMKIVNVYQNKYSSQWAIFLNGEEAARLVALLNLVGDGGVGPNEADAKFISHLETNFKGAIVEQQNKTFMKQKVKAKKVDNK